MSVIKIVPVIGSGVSVDRRLEHRFQERFDALVTVGTRPTEVLRHPDCPKPFEPHPDFGAAFAETPSIEQENIRLYRITVPYTNVELPGQDRYRESNPLNRKAEIDVKSTTRRELIDRDWEDRPLVNTAGDLLVGVEEDETLWDINIVRNVTPTIPAWFEDYGNALNKDTVRIRGRTSKKMQLRVAGIHIPESQFEDGVEFIRLSLHLVYRKKGWERKFLNFGLRERMLLLEPQEDGTIKRTLTNTLVPIRDHLGAKIDQPVPLDKNGRAFRRLVRFKNGNRKVFLRGATEAEIKDNILVYHTRPVLPFRRLPLS